MNTAAKSWKSRTKTSLIALGLALAAYMPVSAQQVAVSEQRSRPVRMANPYSDCVVDTGQTLESFVNGVDGETGGVRLRVHNTQSVGYKWGTTIKVEQVVPGKEYWIAALSEEPMPHLLTTVLELRNCAPGTDDAGHPINPQVVWERAPYTHEVNRVDDQDFMTLYFKGASNSPFDGVRINNLQRKNPSDSAANIQTRQDVPYAQDLNLAASMGCMFPHNALASPQATLDDLQWILGAVWATGQHKLITVRQIGRGTGNDGTFTGPVANGAGKYLIELYNIESELPDGVARKVLAGELDMGGIIENGKYDRDLLRFKRTFADITTYAELFVGKNFLKPANMLDKNYKIATPNEDWAKETIIYRPDIDKRIRPTPLFW